MRYLKARGAVAVYVALAMAAATWLGLGAGWFGGAQLRVADSMFPGAPADARVVIVGIDEASLDHVARWPWPRTVHADLIRRIGADGPAAIGYDVTFSQSSDPGADAELADALRQTPGVVLAAHARFSTVPGTVLQADAFDLPISSFASSARVGHVNVFPDPDGVVRSIPTVVRAPAGELMPSLSLELVRLLEGDAPLVLEPGGVRSGTRLIPTSDAHLLDLNFAGRYPVYSAAEVLRGDVAHGAFADRIVLVGATALGLGDVRLTPLDKATGQPGVELHANAVNTILTERYVSPEPTSATLAVVFVLTLIVALAVLLLRAWLAPVIVAMAVIAIVAVAWRRFDASGTVMNLVYTVGFAIAAYPAAVAFRYASEVRARRHVTRVFSRYLAPDVVDDVLASPESALATLTGASRELTVLFADLRGFTAASASASPEDVVAALNVYLDAMSRAVVSEQGTIDKFMGDCVMAFWGAPRPDDDQAARACRAALKMMDEIDGAMSTEAAQRLPVSGCGIGIATGPAVVGNIGSSVRLDYTAIGDTVNVASRICGVAKPGWVVVTAETAGKVADEIALSELPPLAVKGKTEELRVFLLARPGQPEMDLEISASEQGKGSFQTPRPIKVAGYAPVEPS